MLLGACFQRAFLQRLQRRADPPRRVRTLRGQPGHLPPDRACLATGTRGAIDRPSGRRLAAAPVTGAAMPDAGCLPRRRAGVPRPLAHQAHVKSITDTLNGLRDVGPEQNKSDPSPPRRSCTRGRMPASCACEATFGPWPAFARSPLRRGRSPAIGSSRSPGPAAPSCLARSSWRASAMILRFAPMRPDASRKARRPVRSGVASRAESGRDCSVSVPGRPECVAAQRHWHEVQRADSTLPGEHYVARPSKWFDGVVGCG